MNSLAGSSSLTKFHELVHDGTVSRLGGRKIHLSNGEDVSLDIIRNKYEQLVKTNKDSNPVLRDLPAIFSKWEEQIRKSEDLSYQHVEARASTRDAPRDRAGAQSTKEMKMAQLKNEFSAQEIVELDDIVMNTFTERYTTGKDFEQAIRSVDPTTFAILQEMNPRKFAKALEYLYKRWKGFTKENTSLFFQALLSRPEIWPENPDFSFISSKFRKAVVKARIEHLKATKSSNKEHWDVVLQEVIAYSGKDSKWYRSTYNLSQQFTQITNPSLFSRLFGS